VLCHMDMVPRNVLVRRCPLTEQNELAAIIDWELSGFMPFAFEFACKDTELGKASQHYDFYSLYKSKAQHLVPPGEHSLKLVKAINLIMESRFHQWKRNVGAEIRQRWLAREGLEKRDVLGVWVKKEGVEMG
jgi:thiamine kinase-like enzyme